MTSTPRRIAFSEKEKEDLHELFRIYDFAKVNKVDTIVEALEEKGTSAEEYFRDMFELYKIQPLPNREDAKAHLHEAVPAATDADVESVLRLTEMHGFAEPDAIRTLERQHKVVRTSRPPSRPAGAPPTLPNVHGRLSNAHHLKGDPDRRASASTPQTASQPPPPPSKMPLLKKAPASSQAVPKPVHPPRRLGENGEKEEVGLLDEGDTTSPIVTSAEHLANLASFQPVEEREATAEGAASGSAKMSPHPPVGENENAKHGLLPEKGNADGMGDGDALLSSHPSELQDAISQLRHIPEESDMPEIPLYNSSGNSHMAVGQGSLRRDLTSRHQSVVMAEVGKSMYGDLNRSVSQLSATYSRQVVDEVMAEEVREWVANLVGDKYNADVLAKPNFVDALRNGVVLHVLLQKMEDPPVPDENLKVPKRTTGFFARDNVAGFLAQAKKRYALLDAQVFNNSDLCDAKDDRQVVTCLMSMARVAYSQGSIKIAPTIVMLEKDIEAHATKLTPTDMDRIIQEAERKEREGQAAPGAVSDESVAADTAVHPDGEPEEAVLGEDKRSEKADDPEDEQRDGSPAAAAAHDEPSVDTRPPTSRKTEEPLPSPITPEPIDESNAPDAVSQHDDDDDTRREREEALLLTSPDNVEPLTSEESQDHQPPSSDKSPRSLVGKGSSSSKRKGGDDTPSPPLDIATGTPPPAKAETRGPTPALPDSPKGQPEREEEEVEANGLVGRRKGEWESRIEEGHHVDDKPERRSDAPKHKPTRVVWKVPKTPGSGNGEPPVYRSRRWDGIDVALGNTLNEYYKTSPATPWRFHAVAANAGEYVMYNRDTAQKRVVFVRFIQRKLFIRYSQSLAGPEWVLFADAVKKLDDMFARQQQQDGKK